jgi:hypothetical protein
MRPRKRKTGTTKTHKEEKALRVRVCVCVAQRHNAPTAPLTCFVRPAVRKVMVDNAQLGYQAELWQVAQEETAGYQHSLT